MARIKKLVMHGFKSFAKRTEIPFDKGINVIIGPNGAGKSNISDAICFVLGRLSVKSLRAEKAKNLVFMGSKYAKPAKEAHVEIVFDNSDGAFAIERKEVAIKRIVRIKGQSVYKINDEVKTRAEIIETLAQAGIDPYGFNIILQGQIQSIVKMHGEERRKIIGEVAGISVYEWRKEKSLKELEKTDSRLNEISTILRERTLFLNNLEKEKTQAQRYKDLQTIVKRAKASILKRKHDDKKTEILSISKAVEEKMGHRDKKQEKAEKTQEEINSISERIEEINRHIQKATGLEQGKLRDEISDLRAELEGLRVRKEGFEHRGDEVERRIEEMRNSIPELEEEIKRLKKESPQVAKKAGELRKKKEELAELEKERKQSFALKSSLMGLRERIDDRKRSLARANAESESLVKRIEELSAGLNYEDEEKCKAAVDKFLGVLSLEKKKIGELGEGRIKNEKLMSVSEAEIRRNVELRKKVDEIDTCPLCQSKMTEQHVKHVFSECDEKIKKAKAELQGARKALEEIGKKQDDIEDKILELEGKVRDCEAELVSHKAISDKKETLKGLVAQEGILKKEVLELEGRRKGLESKADMGSGIEEKYRDKMLEIEEISSRTEEDVDTTLLYKTRELEKIQSIVEQGGEDLEEIESQIRSFESDINEKGRELGVREKKEEELNARFKKMFADRDGLQKKFQELNLGLTDIRSEIRQVEDQMNYLKVGKAKLDGERQTIEMDMEEYKGVEILQGSLNVLEEKLRKAQSALDVIGSINLRALEVFESVKKEYDIVKEKVETLQREKDEIMKIIEEIDKKKKKTFMRTFKAINELFSKNFAKLSGKGTAYLEITQPEEDDDVSEANVDIVVKMAKGKYFDVHSLSGGEQTIVALSLLFAIQEYKPYHFYILDEIDAALDKRNSERLAALLDQYMKAGQYIVVTHNDAIILDSNLLYGISMHEGVSKVLSLRVSEEGAEYGKDAGG